MLTTLLFHLTAYLYCLPTWAPWSDASLNETFLGERQLLVGATSATPGFGRAGLFTTFLRS